MSIRRYLPLAFALAAVLSGPLDLAPQATLLAAAPLLLLAPGLLVLDRLRAAAGLGVAARAGVAIVLSLSFAVLVLDGLSLLGLGLDLLVPMLALAVALAVPLLPEPRKRHASGTAGFDGAALLLALASAVAVGARGSAIGPFGDSGMQLAILVRSAETGLPVRSSPLLARASPWSYADGWHRLLATSLPEARPRAEDLISVWHTAGALVAAVRVLAFAPVAIECLAPLPAGVALLVWALLPNFDELPFPRAVGTALLWASLGLAFTAFRTGSRKLEGLVVLAAAGTAAIHPVESYLLSAGLVGYGLLRLADGREALSPLRLALLCLLAALPGMLASNRVLLGEVSRRALSDPSFELRPLMAGLHIVDPAHWGVDLGAPATWLGLLLAPLALRRGPRTARRRVLALAVVAVTGLLFPPASWLVLKLGLPTFLLARVGVLFPTALLAGTGVAAWAVLQRPLVLGLLAITCVAPVVARLALSPLPRAMPAENPLLEPAARALLEELPPGQCVLSDLYSADFLPLAGGHAAVAGITWHASTGERQLTVRDFFADPGQSSAEALATLRDNRVRWVALVRWRDSPADWPGYGSGFLPADAERLLAENPSAFRLAARTRAVSLWQVARRLPPKLAGKDADTEPSFVDPALPALARAGDWDLVAARPRGGGVEAVLRARQDTRDAPLLSVIAVPPGFQEGSALARARRVLGGRRLAHAAGRFPDVFLLDRRYLTERTARAGERRELGLRFAPAPGQELWIGAASDLPRFPAPLGPALSRSFARVGALPPPVQEPDD